MISPTGKGIRKSDRWGSGRYGAKRGDRLHNGVDFICIPGQDIVAPFNGDLVRIRRPYADEPFMGIEFSNPKITVVMFYFDPFVGLVGRSAKKGERIGKAQDISERYPGMIPHIHLHIESIDPQIFIKYQKEVEWIALYL